MGAVSRALCSNQHQFISIVPPSEICAPTVICALPATALRPRSLKINSFGGVGLRPSADVALHRSVAERTKTTPATQIARPEVSPAARNVSCADRHKEHEYRECSFKYMPKQPSQNADLL